MSKTFFQSRKKGTVGGDWKKRASNQERALRIKFPRLPSLVQYHKGFQECDSAVLLHKTYGDSSKSRVNFDQLTICYFAHRRCPPPQVTEFAMASRR